MLKIHGYGDDLTVNDVRIGDLSPLEHEKIEIEKGGKNYKPLENIVVRKAVNLYSHYLLDGNFSHVENTIIDGGGLDYTANLENTKSTIRNFTFQNINIG